MQVARTLHDEHLATLGVLERLEAELARRGHDQIPDAGDQALWRSLAEAGALVDSELIAHFTFEEEALFPLLDEAGDAGISTLLLDEHRTILPIARRVAALGDQARHGCTAGSWDELRRLGLELCERLVSHIQKEEMGLLPMVDTLLDEEQDRALSNDYLALR